MVRAQQKCRHQDDGRHRVRDAQVAPFDPIAGAETVGDRKGRAPEGGPERNEHHGDEDEEDRVAKRDRLEGRLDQEANPRRRRDAFHGVERLAGQRVQRRPVRLLGRQEMSAGGGEHVGPPVPGGDEQQDGEQNRVRRKEERDLAVGEAKRPGDLRGDVIADGARQDAATACGAMPRRSVPLVRRSSEPRTYHIRLGLPGAQISLVRRAFPLVVSITTLC